MKKVTKKKAAKATGKPKKKASASRTTAKKKAAKSTKRTAPKRATAKKKTTRKTAAKPKNTDSSKKKPRSGAGGTRKKPSKSDAPQAASSGPKKKVLSGKDLDHFKKKLLAEKQRVLAEMGEMQQSNLKQSVSDQSGENSRYSYHLGDVASLSYGREFSMGLAERQQKYLEQVYDALDRIEQGNYGICLVTGEPIPKERLEEVPVAKYSVKGKEIIEQQRRRMGLQ